MTVVIEGRLTSARQKQCHNHEKKFAWLLLPGMLGYGAHDGVILTYSRVPHAPAKQSVGLKRFYPYCFSTSLGCSEIFGSVILSRVFAAKDPEDMFTAHADERHSLGTVFLIGLTATV